MSRASIAAIATALLAGVAAPYFLDRYMITLLSLAFALAVLAMSLDLLVGYTGLVSLGHASLMAVSAYGVALVTTHGGGYVLQLVAGIAAAIVVSVVFGLMVMRLSGVYFLLITLAQGMTVWGLLYRLATITGGENGIRGVRRPPAVEEYWKWYYVTLAALFVCALLLRIVVRSPLGLAIRGIRDSDSRMRSLGYNTTRCKLYIFVIAGLFAGVAGVLYVYYAEFISPDASEFRTSGKALLMTILGGVGTLVGPVIGAITIVLFEGYVSLYVERWPTLLGTLFILAVLFAREGLVGLVWSWRRSWKERQSSAVARARVDPAAGPEVAVERGSAPGGGSRTGRSNEIAVRE